MRSFGPRSTVSLRLLLATALWMVAPIPAAAADPPPIMPLNEFAPSFLGSYRKVMLIEDQIITFAAKYGVDVQLAKAVCLYESGGNANLRSSAGAGGYFQVMPATFRLMKVETNIEAGIKYLGQMVKQLWREDYALAAYNGGPGRVARRRPMPLESLQYVIGVGSYRSVLRAYEPSVRAHAEQLALGTIEAGEDWWALSKRLNTPVVQLRLHNPFLAGRPLKAGYTVSYPPEPRTDVFALEGNETRFITRLGDNYLKVAFALGVDLDLLRETNGLWRLQAPLPGTELTIPRDPKAAFASYTVGAGENIEQLAARANRDPWDIVVDNSLWHEDVHEGMVLRVRDGAKRAAAEPAATATAQVHRVKSGDTLSALARRYRTTVRAIQEENALGRLTRIRVGQRLRIPS